jgi:hypothetical protein
VGASAPVDEIPLGHLGGVLLWPGVALHAVVALLLAWTWRDGRRTKATNT